jgi:hypothetical protein
MNKLSAPILIILLFGGIVFLISCGKEEDFSDTNTFNLDTLYAKPDSGITDHFQLIWEVSIEGFPQFLIDIYLSDDYILDVDYIKMIETADTDITTDPDQPYINGINIRMTPSPGNGTQIEFSHDLLTWQSGAVLPGSLNGQKKYIIGRFYHPLGLQIIVGRTRMAVEVDFN